MATSMGVLVAPTTCVLVATDTGVLVASIAVAVAIEVEVAIGIGVLVAVMAVAVAAVVPVEVAVLATPGVGVLVAPSAWPQASISFVSNVTAPLRAYKPVFVVVPVFRVMEVSARMFPAKLVSVPRVAELPTCQKIRHG